MKRKTVMSGIGGKCLSNAQSCIFAVLALSAQFAFAMPNKDEIKLVQPMVLELMSTHQKNFNAKKETAKEVGDSAVSLADKAEGEAAKYILLKGAIEYYTLAKEYDLAADTLESLRASVKDLPAEEVATIASRALNRARQGEAQRLRAISRIASMRAKAEADVKSCKSVLRKKPDDKDALSGLADAYVRLDDWPRALKVFQKLGNNAAAFELNPAEAKDFDSLKAADYWWDFRPKDAELYRAHAAVLYKTAMGEGLVKGLKQPLVEKRIAEAESFGLTSTSLDGKGDQAADASDEKSARSSGEALSTEGPLLDDLQKKLNANLAELKKLVDKNPACYLNPSSTSIVNVSKKIATAKDKRYCSCINVTLVRDMFYCTSCKHTTPYSGDRDYDRGCCRVSSKQSFFRWLSERKNVDATARINKRIDELRTENEALEKQIRSMKRSRR